MNHPTHPLRWSVAGAVLGLVALGLLAAILGGAVASIRANNTVDRFAIELTKARDQIADLEADNVRLAEQNRRILEQNRTLVRFLRKHGLQIPQRSFTTQPDDTPPAESSPAGGSTPSPKAPTPSPRRSPTPGAPGPTATPTPTASPSHILGPVCDVVPLLCP